MHTNTPDYIRPTLPDSSDLQLFRRDQTTSPFHPQVQMGLVGCSCFNRQRSHPNSARDVAGAFTEPLAGHHLRGCGCSGARSTHGRPSIGGTALWSLHGASVLPQLASLALRHARRALAGSPLSADHVCAARHLRLLPGGPLVLDRLGPRVLRAECPGHGSLSRVFLDHADLAAGDVRRFRPL